MKLIEKYRGYQIKAFTKRDGVEDHKIGSFVVITPDGIEDWEADTVKECKQFIDGKKGTPSSIKLYQNERAIIMQLCKRKIDQLVMVNEDHSAIQAHIDTLKRIVDKL